MFEKSPEHNEGIDYAEIIREIEAMHIADQAMREKADKDPEFWDEEIDRVNTIRMREIVSRVGWLSISKVGVETSQHAWNIVQHSDHDIEFQRHCLELMKQLLVGEVSLHDIAFLEDRILVNSGQLQTYGTQFDDLGDTLVPQPIIDPEHVDERRKSMGMGTLEERIDEMYAKYGMIRPDKNK